MGMGDLVGNKRTAEREVNGITFDMRSDDLSEVRA